MPSPVPFVVPDLPPQLTAASRRFPTPTITHRRPHPPDHQHQQSHRRRRFTVLAVTGALTGTLVAAMALPALAAAAGWTAAPASLPAVIDSLTAWLVGLLAALATLFLTIGGLRYLTAGGDPMQVERAKTALKSAAIGYALAALAPLLVKILASVVGG